MGDDPKDLLIKDFGVRNILDSEGMKKWERFIELKILIKIESELSKKDTLSAEYLKIGSDYNLPSR